MTPSIISTGHPIPGVIPKPRAFRSGARDLACCRLRSAAYQNAVPVDLQIRGDANLVGSASEFACEVGGHGAWASGGESHVVHHAFPVAVGVFCFDVRSDRVD